MAGQKALPGIAAALLFTLPLVACSGSSRMHGDAVPEEAENPIELRFTDLTVADAIAIATSVISDFPITALQADPDRGYLETQWVDINRYEKFAGAYPDRERMVQFQFTVTTLEDQVRELELSTVYRPNDPTRDRLVPLDHPGYTMALKMEERYRERVINRGGKLVHDEI